MGYQIGSAVRSDPKFLLLVVIAAMLAGCASAYKEFYRAARGAKPDVIAARRPSAPPANPIVERARPGNGDAIFAAYAKRGYVMIGESSFNSGGRQSDDSAVQQARDVGADLVVILDPRYTGSHTSSIPITTPTTSTSYSTGSATAFGPGGSVTAFGSGTTTTYGTTTNYVPVTVHRSDYGALYFVKQRFSFGAFFRDLTDAERQELQSNKGVAIRLVVDGSPAFDADILADDIITAVDGISVWSAASVTDVLRERSGKLVSVSIVRRGQRIERPVHLQR